MATKAYDERLAHAARIRQVARERHDEQRPFVPQAHRRITVARIVAAGTAVALTVASAATAVAAHPTLGGGAHILVR
ncbi:MAG TPA: hypothetical protein VFM03_05040 [Candidatus Limnocylindria bacterium]|nr:hypothetical protein [Candidatus Limnocylindria bacterium]